MTSWTFPRSKRESSYWIPPTFSLRDSLSTAVKALGLRASAKGLELICDVDAKVPDTLIGDPLRLRQIVTNLVGKCDQIHRTRRSGDAR